MSAAPPLAEAIRGALALALGTGAPPRTEEAWRAALGVAARERLAALAWRWSGETIRRAAPPEVAARWRQLAVSIDALGRAQLLVLGEVLERLEARGLAPVVLKGAPLSSCLYGDHAVRGSADLDLHLPAAQRDAADDALRSAGWRATLGRAPWTVTYERGEGRGAIVDLHSSLVADELAHLPVPAPEWRWATIEGVTMRAHAGPLVAAYLATHLAKHSLPALLWDVDVATLWRLLSEEERTVARASAARAGLHRYLEWAVQRAGRLRAAAGDERAAAALFRVRGGRRTDGHAAVRDLRLAPDVDAAVRAAGAWLWPRPLRDDPGAMARRLWGRATGRGGMWLRPTRGYQPPPARSIPLESDDFRRVVADVLGGGGALWTVARGSSMEPAIPAGSAVRLAAPGGPVAPGDVVLVAGEERPILHRVIARREGELVLRGDNLPAPDPPVPERLLLGVATHVLVDGREVPLAERPRVTLRSLVRRARRALAHRPAGEVRA